MLVRYAAEVLQSRGIDALRADRVGDRHADWSKGVVVTGNPWFWYGLSMIFFGLFILGLIIVMKQRNR